MRTRNGVITQPCWRILQRWPWCEDVNLFVLFAPVRMPWSFILFVIYDSVSSFGLTGFTFEPSLFLHCEQATHFRNTDLLVHPIDQSCIATIRKHFRPWTIALCWCNHRPDRIEFCRQPINRAPGGGKCVDKASITSYNGCCSNASIFLQQTFKTRSYRYTNVLFNFEVQGRLRN